MVIFDGKAKLVIGSEEICEVEIVELSLAPEERVDWEQVASDTNAWLNDIRGQTFTCECEVDPEIFEPLGLVDQLAWGDRLN